MSVVYYYVMSEQIKPTNWKRVAFVGLYFAIFLAIVLYRFDSLFYVKPSDTSYNFDRFLWCFACSCLSFAILAFQFRRHEKSPFPEYESYYPFLLLVISSLGFSVCHVFDVTKGFVFYYLSFGLCSILSYLVDSFWALLTSLIKNRAK